MHRPTLLAAATALALAWPARPAAQESQASPPPPPAPAAPATTAPAAGAPEHGAASWPRALPTENGTVVVYQPQFEKLEGVKLTGRAAVSWEAKEKEPIFGVFWFESKVQIDKAADLVEFETFKVTKVRFPNSTPPAEKRAADFLTKEIPNWNLDASLAELTAALAASDLEARTIKGIKAVPPKIIVSREPAVLVLYDGAPIVRKLEGSSLERVVNTPMLVLRDPGNARLYLTNGEIWFEAADPKGPWSPVSGPSPAVADWFARNPPPKDPEAEQAKAAAPPKAGAPEPAPKILVATEPTELLVFDGAPNYVPVTGESDLLIADNCDGNVLVHVPTGETFLLVAGRWFKAKSLDGPWSAVRPDQLPPAFARIPPGSLADSVRTFVAGTEEARDALADTQIPQTSAVKRDQSLQVTYDGEPKFKAIEGTGMAYAVNTSFSVIQDSGRYWACHQAVWYVAPTPKGPWAVSDRRPPSIDQVPPSAPVYNTRYVYVYQATPSVVYVGYLPGYVGVYPYYGTVVYGTGWYYPPYVGPVYYYPRPVTYGVHMTYNPWTGFGVGVSYGTPYMRVSIHFGGYGGWYGAHGYHHPPYPPHGYRPPPPGYRPPPGGGYRPPPGGGYRPPPPGAAGGRPPAAQASIYNRPDNAGRNASTRDQAAPGRRPAAPAQQPNNVYGDRSGNVYRQNQGGGWDKNTGKGWQQQGGGSAGARPSPQPAGGGRPAAAPSTRPSSAPAGLNRDAAARTRGGGGRGGGRR